MSVNLPDELAERVKAAATARDVTPEQVAIDAIEAAVPQQRRRLSFAGLGRSGASSGGAQADELIAEHFAGKSARDV